MLSGDSAKAGARAPSTSSGIREALPGDRRALEALLRQRIDLNVYLLGVLARGETLPHTLSEDGQFTVSGAPPEAVVYHSLTGLTIPFATHPAGIAAITRATLPRIRLTVGAPEHVAALMDAAGSSFQPRLDLPHRLYRLSPAARPPRADSGVRRAGPADLDDVCDALASMQGEEFGTDPERYRTPGFFKRVRRLVSEGKCYIVRERGELVFHASANSQSPDGAQIEAVWTAPWRRGRGLARRAVSDVCHALLGQYPRVVLGVAESNHPAIRVYERVGFQLVAPLRLASL